MQKIQNRQYNTDKKEQFDQLTFLVFKITTNLECSKHCVIGERIAT